MGLSDLRKRKSLTQKQLACAIGVSESTICKYENGTLTPPLDKVLAISSVLGKDYLDEFKDIHVDYHSIVNLSQKIKAQSNDDKSCSRSCVDDFSISDCPSNLLYDCVVKNADYQCQLCGIHSPESTNHFLELYFINTLDTNELYVKDQFVALCPNCLKLLSNSFSVDIANKLNELIKRNKANRKKYNS